MSDISQGEGWWQASDGKWYAPELHPDYVAPSSPEAAPAEPDAGAPTEAVPTAGSDATVPVAPPGAVDPTVPVAPIGSVDPTLTTPVTPAGPPPVGPPITTFGTPPPPAEGSGGGKGKLIAAIVVVLALIGGGIAFALTRGDDNKTATSNTDQSTDTTGSTDSTDSSSSSTKSSSSDSTSALLAKAKKALLVPSDVDPSFKKATAPDSSAPLPCTGDDPDTATPPAGKEATELDKGSDIAIIESIRVYKSTSDAKKAFSAAKDGFDCSGSSDGTLSISGSPSKAGIKGADDDFSIDASYTGGASASTGNLHKGTSQTSTDSSSTDPFATDSSSSTAAGPDFYVSYFVVRVGQSILSFNYISTPTADTSQLDDPKTITNTGVAKFVK